MPAAASPPNLGADNAHYLTPTVPPPMSDQNKKALREAFGSFATGITVVATRQADGTRRGFTANSFTSVSLDPPLVLICIAKTGLSYEVFRTSTCFSVNVLSDAQRDISKIFASQSANKFDLGEWTHGAAEMPVLRDALANFICQRENLVEAGDHVIMIGRVLDMQIQQGAPLGYFKGNYFSVGLDQSLISAVPNPAP